MISKTKDVLYKDIPTCSVCKKGISVQFKDGCHYNGWGTFIQHENCTGDHI